MKRISEMVQLTPKCSKLDFPCEIVPGHMIEAGKNYATIKFHKDVIVNLPGGARPVSLDVEMRCCYDCVSAYLYDVMSLHRDLQLGRG